MIARVVADVAVLGIGCTAMLTCLHPRLKDINPFLRWWALVLMAILTFFGLMATSVWSVLLHG